MRSAFLLLRPTVVPFAVVSLITGVIYPLTIAGIAQVAASDTASGSILTNADGKPIGATWRRHNTSNAAFSEV